MFVAMKNGLNSSFLSLLLLFIFVFTSCSKTKEIQLAQEITAKQKHSDTNALFYKIQKENEAPSFLLGTIHLYPANDYTFSDTLLNCIENCDQLVCELDMLNLDPNGIAQIAVMKDGMLISDLLDSAQFAQVDERVRQFMGAPLQLINNWKPALIAMLIQDEGNGNLQTMASMEMDIVLSSGEKVTGGLESLEEQINLFDVMSYKEQAEYLLEALEVTGDQTDFELLFETYLSQDLNILDSLLFTDDFLNTHKSTFLDQRNLNWIPKIDSISGNRKVFFAVGAGHLHGEKGLLLLLREAGFDIEAIAIPILEAR